MSRTVEPRGIATVPDVARAAGVSTATAARALGGYGSVRESTRERVQAAAEQLGYRPNSLARSMITGSTSTLGVVMSDIENPFFRRSLRGIADTARAEGFEVLLANTDEQLDKEETAVRLMTERRVDGLVVCPADGGDRSHISDVIAAGIPVVLLDRRVAGVKADTVGIDNRKAARTATEYLLGRGHRDIAIVTGGTPEMLERMLRPDMRGIERLSATTVGARAAGFRDAMAAAGVPIRRDLISSGGYRREDAETETARLLSLPNPPTAVFAFDAMQSLGAFHAISRAGVRCPDDISLLGFDDAEWADVVSPGLTVMAQPTYEIGVAACRLLLSRIEGSGGAVAHRRLPTELIERGSVAVRPPHPDAEPAR
ncbi:LacI family DNA-binding transcriptional regulator [Terrabacter sp. GCM10028922]|uniref:LacI family DNA-binding transcriptional regulator n=1 Tax=Terrabacter sp. GCM10028922 TaxID=3273428 RepID=UPI00361C3E8A